MMVILFLVLALVVLAIAHWYFTRCEKCGSWLNFLDESSHYDEHQNCRWVHRYRACHRCQHRVFLGEYRTAPSPFDIQFRRRS